MFFVKLDKVPAGSTMTFKFGILLNVTPDGSEKHVYLSFQNASPAEQAEWEQIADETTPQTIAELSDPLPENMTREQYEAYLDEAGDDSFKVKDEYRF